MLQSSARKHKQVSGGHRRVGEGLGQIRRGPTGATGRRECCRQAHATECGW